MKKLLIFHQALAPYRVDLFNHLAERFDTELVLFDTNLVNQKFDQGKLVGRMKCRVSYLLGGFRWKDRYFRTGAIRKIWKSRPDVILGCEYSLVTIAIVLYRFMLRRKFQLYSMTDDNLLQFKARRGLKAILRWCFVRLLDGFIVTNKETKAAFESITPQGSQMRYSAIPILHDEGEIRKDEEAIIAAGREWRNKNLNEWNKVALFVGRLDPVKNVKWLVESFGQLAQEYPDKVALVMVGTGSQENEIRQYAKEHELTNVYLVGRREGRGVYEMMAMADCLVLPSTFEPYGAVVGEALQWGTPCLVSDSVGAKGLIEKRNGRVFETGDKKDFADKLEQTLNLGRSDAPLVCDMLGACVDRFADEIDRLTD